MNEPGTWNLERGTGYAVAVFLAVFVAPGVLVAAFATFTALAAVFRCSDVCVPNFFVNRSTRPSVSISF
jgi:hypothetical protein